MNTEEIDTVQNDAGARNLGTYRTLFIVKGALNCLVAVVGLIYMGLSTAVGPEIRRQAIAQGEPLPFDPGAFFMGVGVTLLFLGLVLAVLAFVAAGKLNKRESHGFIIVAAALNCLTGILGILLCVFTVIELQKKEVKAVFGK